MSKPPVSPGSRHYHAETYTWSKDQEAEIELLAPRRSEHRTMVLVHRVVSTDRLDLLAARYFGDPKEAWRIVDANPCTTPDELLELGRLLRIPRSD